MIGAASSTGGLHIDRVSARYLVSRGHPEPLRVKRRLDRAVSAELPRTLRALLSPWFARDDPGVWLLRRLQVELDVDAALDHRRLARRWANAIARSLADTLSEGSDDADVLWFPSRAAYLGRFLADLAAGHAWGRWRYRSFEGLRPLSLSAAVRTALCDAPAVGIEALLGLRAAELSQLLDGVTAADGERILDRLAATGKRSRIDGERLVAVTEIAGRPGPALQGSRAALGLFVSVCRERPEMAGPALRDLARALACLARRLALAPADGPRLLSALAAADLRALGGGPEQETLAPLLGVPEAVLGPALGELSGDGDPRVSPAGGDQRQTPFGAIFLLLPLIDELPLTAATAAWPALEGTPADRLLRFLLLIKCCGAPRANLLFQDPLARDLGEVHPRLGREDLAGWAAALSRRRVEGLLSAVHAHPNHRPSGSYVLTSVSRPGAPVAVLIAAEDGRWLRADGFRPERPERWLARLEPRLGAPGARCWTDDTLRASLASAYPDLELRPAATSERDQGSGASQVLTRLDKLAGELDYLALPRQWRVARRLDLALSVVAQGVLRRFARHLPGFGGSSLPYLFANFLDFPATLEEEPERRLVRLGRPPLHLVLSRTTLPRAAYRLSWLDERPLSLFPEC